MFPGFFRPKTNFYKLPNDWFDIWIQARRQSGRSRIHTILKTTEYVIKWTWGYQNYDEPVRISWRNFQYGRLRKRRRLDRGTGLSSDGLQNALRLAEKLGFLETHEDENSSENGLAYLPRLRQPEEDNEAFLGSDSDESIDEPWAGFNLPEANYFMVPAIWTDLTSDTNSATLILTVEYFFRHTWGWQGGWDEPRWLTEEEIANGRRYRSRERRGHRYDAGIGYSARSVRSALAEGVRQRWLVWREDETTGKKRYALHLKGMNVSPAGEFLGFQGNATKDDDSPLPTNQEPPETNLPSAIESGPHEETTAHLQAQVATLARTVGQLQKAVSLALSDSFQDQEGVEAIRAPLEANRAPLEAIGAPDGSYQSASYTDTFSDTSVQTPPPDTALDTRVEDTALDEVKDAAAPAMPNSSDSGGGIPGALLNRLASLEPPVSPEVATDLIATFGQQRVAATLDVVERDPTVTSIAAVLIYRLRAGQTPPGGKQLEETMATGGERASRWEPDAG